MMNVPGLVRKCEEGARAILNRGAYKDLSVSLILAIIWQESSGNQWAYNPEPRYPYLWNVRLDAPFRKQTPAEIASETPPADWPCYTGDPDQEWWAQQASWGLMQLMGAAAREQRFHGNYLTELCDPYVNLEFGVRHLWNYAFQCGNRTRDAALLRWNGGGDPAYPQKIAEKLAALS